MGERVFSMIKRLLAVDDSTFVLEELKRVLPKEDFEVVGFAKTGEQAILLYGELLPDIVTLDIVLPGMDGLETGEQIISRWPDAKIVFMSSLAYDETVNHAKKIGAYGFIFKPFNEADVIHTLQSVASNNSPEDWFAY